MTWSPVAIGLLVIAVFYSTGRSEKDSAMVEDPRRYLPGDTILPNGYYIKYELNSLSAYTVHWGNNRIKRSSEPQYILGPPADYLYYECHNDNCIILSAGCGSPCWYIYVLPLDSSRPIKKIWYPFAYDMENNLVAGVEFSGDTIMRITNFETYKDTSLLGKGCGDAWFGSCIDSVSIVKREFYLRHFITDDYDSPVGKRKTKEIHFHVDL
jgi:hypothetical protein